MKVYKENDLTIIDMEGAIILSSSQKLIDSGDESHVVFNGNFIYLSPTDLEYFCKRHFDSKYSSTHNIQDPI